MLFSRMRSRKTTLFSLLEITLFSISLLLFATTLLQVLQRLSTPALAVSEPIGDAWITYAATGQPQTISGWACDPDGYNLPVTVDFYLDGYPTGLVGQTVANQPSNSSVQSACGGSSAGHNFVYTLPAQALNGSAHSIMVYTRNVNVGGGSIGSSMKLLSIPASAIDIKVNGQDSTVTVTPGSTITISWTGTNVAQCDTGTSIAPWGPYTPIATNGTTTRIQTEQQFTYGIQCTFRTGQSMIVQDQVGVQLAAATSAPTATPTPAPLPTAPPVSTPSPTPVQFILQCK